MRVESNEQRQAEQAHRMADGRRSHPGQERTRHAAETLQELRYAQTQRT